MISINQIINTYNKIKKLANKALKNHEFEQALRHIEAAASLAYNFNFIYSDKDLENSLSLISEKIIISQNFKPIENRVVFFDSFVLDNRGLTQQYIRSLIVQEKEILFINDGDSLLNGQLIIKELLKYNKCEIFQVSTSLSRIEKINLIYNKVFEFKPKQVLLHLSPTNVIAPVVFSALTSSSRFLINLTDHAFWLGTCCIDYCLEFRDYGYTISLQKRKINSEKLLYQPYYPIADSSEYLDLPFSLINNKIILTGGAFYKMYGEDDIFFNILQNLIKLDSRILILIIGDGHKSPLLNFITKNKLENKIILLGNRKDINHIFSISDIYLSTFPISGGLMTQLAAVNHKPILSFSSEKFQFNNLNGILEKNLNLLKTYCNVSELLLEANKIIESEIYRKQSAENAFKSLISIDEFNRLFKKNINSPLKHTTFEIININYEAIIDLYLEIENSYQQQFNFLLLSKYKKSIIFYFPSVFISIIFSKFFYIRMFKKLIKF